jgi:hypothetical protein
MVSQRQAPVEVLALDPRRVDLVGLAPPGLGEQRHLLDIGQAEQDAVAEQFLDASPALGAFLNPGNASRGARRQAGLLDHLLESLLRCHIPRGHPSSCTGEKWMAPMNRHHARDQSSGANRTGLTIPGAFTRISDQY